MKQDNSHHRFMFKFENNKEGWEKFESLKSILNKDRYALVIKYNGKSIPNVYQRGAYGCAKEYATEVRVYANIKDKVKAQENRNQKQWEKDQEIQQAKHTLQRTVADIEERYSWYLREDS